MKENSKERNKPLFIAFTTQKGGAGKSVFTTLMASYLHYKCGYSVVIVDCDKGQYSLHRMRNRDQRVVESDIILLDKFNKQLESTGKPAYPILCAPAMEAVDVAERFLANSSEEYDIVLFDMVGTVETKGVMQCVAELDYIFTPIISDRLSLESSLAFALTAKEHLLESATQKLKGIYLFWNQVLATERTSIYDDYTDIIRELGLPILNTYIPNMVRYKKELCKGQKEVFRSTLFPISPKLLKGSRFDELVDEILNIIKLERDNGKE